MTESIQKIKSLISILDRCSDDERMLIRNHLQKQFPHPLETEWGIEYSLILSAIRRSSDLTRRGVRGIIAEAVFEEEIVPQVQPIGWNSFPVVGDLAYDVLLRKGTTSARIQIKLQRLEKHEPKLYYPRHYEPGSFFVVEVQKTRSGERVSLPIAEASSQKSRSLEVDTYQTRPYRFGDFDILAVNMHPSTRDWKSFRYTLGSWLLPRLDDESLMEIFQPVSATPNDVWTDSLATSLRWFESGEKGTVLAERRHQRKRLREPPDQEQ